MTRLPLGVTVPYRQVIDKTAAKRIATVARPWVGLTKKEVDELVAYPMNPTADLVRKIEKMLKEKNYG